MILPYANFAVVFRPDRRLAAATAVMIDGARLIDVPREDEWRFDPRLPEAQQAGHLIYQDNPLDKGHLVRRLDPVWGPDAPKETTRIGDMSSVLRSMGSNSRTR